MSSEKFLKKFSLEPVRSTTTPRKSMIGNIDFSNNRFLEETKEGQKLANSLLVIKNPHHGRRQHPKRDRDEAIDSSQKKSDEHKC